MKTLSLELSKELTELCKSKGIAMPESYMGWFHNTSYEKDDIIKEFYLDVRYKVIDMAVQFSHFFVAPAYTLDEIMDWLPAEIKYQEDNNVFNYKLSMNTFDSNTGERYYQPEYACIWGGVVESTLPNLPIVKDNPCDAVGKLLMWVIKEGYL